MGATLNDLLKNEGHVTVKYGDLEINAAYRPGAYTPTAVAEFRDSKDVLRDFVNKLVISWDITNNDGSPLPVEEGVDLLPVQLLGSLVEAINEDMAGKETEANSDAG